MTKLSSRTFQNLQHIVGGLNSLLLLISGILIGQNRWMHSIITVISYFVLNRLSSEIFYRTLKAIELEHVGEKRNKCLR